MSLKVIYRSIIFILSSAILFLPNSYSAERLISSTSEVYTIDKWTIDEGLPQNTVTSIIQTRDGYLWFGTRNGLVRFDGLRFTIFDECNTPGLSNSRICKVFEDSESNLWIGTETADVMLIKNGQITSIQTSKAIPVPRLISLCEDKLKTIWLCTADGLISRFEQQKIMPLPVELQNFSSLQHAVAENNQNVWLGSDHQIISLDLGTNLTSVSIVHTQTISKLDYLLPSQSGGIWCLADGRIRKMRGQMVEKDYGLYPWKSAPVSSVCEDGDKNLIVGTLGMGLYWFKPDGKASWISAVEGLSHDVVLSLCTDREGNLWVGTDGGGLNRIKHQLFQNIGEKQGMPGYAVQSAYEDEEGGIWIGYNGGGIARWTTDGIQRYQGLFSSHVWSVFIDDKRQVWAGTINRGLFQLRDGIFYPITGVGAIAQTIQSIYQDAAGRLWFGGQNGLAVLEKGGWRQYTQANGLSADTVQAMTGDSDGNLWIGTTGGGLNRLKDGKITVFRKADGLSSDDISCLLMDREGVLWIGTPGSGLGRYFRDKWTWFTTQNGLASNSIGYMVEDEQGFIWIGSNVGLMRLAKSDLNNVNPGQPVMVHCRLYGKRDGMPSSECTVSSQPAGFLSRDEKLYFPTVKGLASLNPSQLKKNLVPPLAHIESVWIDGQRQNTNILASQTSKSWIIPAGRQRLEIHYTSLNLGAADKARFMYRMGHYEKLWTEAGNSRIARYPKLPAGEYQFELRACNEDGVWNDKPVTLSITVEPPFWQTGWFIGLFSLSFLGIIVGTVHYFSTQKLQRQVAILKHQEALEKDRARIAHDIHDQVGASLTQVALLGELVESDKDQPEEVATYARQISQTVRDTSRILDEIVWAVNPSNDTLEGLVSYACKHVQDFLSVTHLKYRLDVPEILPPIPLLPEFRHNIFLAFKEALNNVVRHAGASSVRISLHLDTSLFVLEIEDDGRGLEGMDPKKLLTRNGVRNMRNRLESIGGTFSLSPGNPKGAIVRLSAPLKVGAKIKQ